MESMLRAFVLIAIVAAVGVALWVLCRFCASIPRAFRSGSEGSEARFMIVMAPIALVGILAITAGYRYETMQSIASLLQGHNTASVQEVPQQPAHKHHK